MRWVIGDIHGMFTPLDALVRAIDRIDKERQLMFVGDYVNRGPDGKRVIELLLSLPQAYFVRGNHDDIFDQVLSGLSYCAKPGDEQRIASFQWFMQHGLHTTFLSYGIEPWLLEMTLNTPTIPALDNLAKAIPLAHRQFIRNLPVVLETPDMFVAHAKWDVQTPTQNPSLRERLDANELTRYNLLWGRYIIQEVDAEKTWERIGYFGHTPVDNYRDDKQLLPLIRPKIILLDTAAALVAHGRLTAVCHETGTFLQSDVAGNMVDNK